MDPPTLVFAYIHIYIIYKYRYLFISQYNYICSSAPHCMSISQSCLSLSPLCLPRHTAWLLRMPHTMLASGAIGTGRVCEAKSYKWCGLLQIKQAMCYYKSKTTIVHHLQDDTFAIAKIVGLCMDRFACI